jgi:hypothetical protein
MSDDLFDSVIDIENQLMQKGLVEGQQHGAKQGIEDGFELGHDIGFQLGQELGYYQGFLNTILFLQQTNGIELSQRFVFILPSCYIKSKPILSKIPIVVRKQ